jgi:hypothetical protein
MDTVRRNDGEERNLGRCSDCNATVIAEGPRGHPAEGNNVCALCGLTLVDPPFEGGDYFDMIMRSDRPPGRAARRRWQGRTRRPN